MVHLLLVGSLVHLSKVGITGLEAVGSIGCQSHTRRAHQPSNLEPNAAGCIGHLLLLVSRRGKRLSNGLCSKDAVTLSSWGLFAELQAFCSLLDGKRVIVPFSG